MQKVIVLTGASSGFGKGIALKLATQKCNLVLAARRDQLLEELAQQCCTLGGRAIAVATDVGVKTEVEALCTAALQEFGRIDAWINNAGAGAVGLFDAIPLEAHEKVIETDLLGTIYGSWFAIQQFKQAGHGMLINVASVAGKIPHAFYSSYVAAKHGVIALSDCIRLELKESKLEDAIHVCVVAPAAHDTPFFEHAANFTGHATQAIPPLHDADDVIEAVINLLDKPKDEVVVGNAQVQAMTFAHHFMPGTVEGALSHQSKKAATEGPPEQPHSGSLQQPKGTGRDVHAPVDTP